jgi:hypothetical protein
MMTMSVPCISRKLDWMLVNRRDQLRKIMNDNGVFLSIPPIGSNIGSIRVIGDDPIFVERSIRSLMVLVSTLYSHFFLIWLTYFVLIGLRVLHLFHSSIYATVVITYNYKQQLFVSVRFFEK